MCRNIQQKLKDTCYKLTNHHQNFKKENSRVYLQLMKKKFLMHVLQRLKLGLEYMSVEFRSIWISTGIQILHGVKKIATCVL